MLELYTISKDKKMYRATASYENGQVTVHKGSTINRTHNARYGSRSIIGKLRDDDTLFDDTNVLNKDVTFNSLSASASFVTGRTANGKIVWKTKDGKRVKHSFNEEA